MSTAVDASAPVLNCTGCGGQVIVHAGDWIDPQRFLCLTCIDAPAMQLNIEVPAPRIEHRTYDPRISAIPF